MEIHTGGEAEAGQYMKRDEEEGAKNTLTAQLAQSSDKMEE